MTGDRRLTVWEQHKFKKHELIFLDKATDEGGEPTLHDAALIEIKGILEAHSNLIINFGARIKILEDEIKKIEEAIDKS